MKKILLFGSSGFLGKEMFQILTEKKLHFHTLSHKQCDLSNREEIFEAVRTLKLDAIINCTGFTGFPNVDDCETNKEECWKKNYTIPKNLSEVTRELGIKWIHVSSGCIFQGDNDGKGFREQDPPNFCFDNPPCSYYSGTKSAAEDILRNDKNVYICRLRIPFSNIENRKNYITKILKFNKVLNATNSLSNITDFANAALYLLENDCDTGIYNLTNTGSTDTKSVVKLLNKHITNKEFLFFKNDEEFYSTAAISPRSNCILNNEKILNTGFKMPHISEALEKAIINYKRDLVN